MSKLCTFKKLYLSEGTSFQNNEFQCPYCIGNFPDDIEPKCENFLYQSQEKGCKFRRKVREIDRAETIEEMRSRHPIASKILAEIARKRAI